MSRSEEQYFYTAMDARTEMAGAYVSSFAGRGRALDVGCNTGFLVETLRNRGFDAMGCDRDPAAAEAGRRLGRPITCGDIHAAAGMGGNFVAVIFNHTLEHIVDLRDALAAASSLLARDGRLFILVPNIKSLRARCRISDWAPLIPYEHVWHFEPRTLLACVTQLTNFRVIDLRTSDLHCQGIKDVSGWRDKGKVVFRRAAASLGHGEQICAAFKSGA